MLLDGMCSSKRQTAQRDAEVDTGEEGGEVEVSRPSCYSFAVKSLVKTFILIALSGLALSVSTTAVWIYVNRDVDGLVFGQVVSAGPTVILVEDRAQRVTTVTVTPQTIVADRLKVLSASDIVAGEFVQVAGKRIGKNKVEAKTIRLMRSPRGSPSSRPDEVEE